jgi:hypothetical protein
MEFKRLQLSKLGRRHFLIYVLPLVAVCNDKPGGWLMNRERVLQNFRRMLLQKIGDLKEWSLRRLLISLNVFKALSDICKIITLILLGNGLIF